MGGLKLKGSIFDILNILFSYFIIALFFRRISRVLLKFIDLYLSRQAGKFVSFSLSVPILVVLGGGGG